MSKDRWRERRGDGRGGHVVTGKGFEIGGPVGDRKIIQRRLPEYPAWAEEKGIMAMVKIYFTVRPDGSLRSTLRILSSSGYADLDDPGQSRRSSNGRFPDLGRFHRGIRLGRHHLPLHPFVTVISAARVPYRCIYS